MNRVTALIAMAAILAVPVMVSAAIIPLTAKITEDQATTGGVNVPSGSNSLGVGSFEYDTDTDMLTGNILILDVLLSTPETASHIHGPANHAQSGMAPIDAPVIHPLPLGDLKPVSVEVGTLYPGAAADLLANKFYVNVHTGAFPDGEIRGQIEVVPEPASMLLAGVGLIFLVGYVVRRRK